MNDQVVHLTKEGFQKFEAELSYLRTVRRSELAERLRLALEEGGDLVENAEFEDAKNEQAFVEGRIQYLETLLTRAQIMEGNGSGSPGVIGLNSKVTVKEDGEEAETFHIVGAAEADPMKGRISDVSPLGRALTGHKVGDKVVVSAPDGSFTYTITKVE